MSPSASNSGNEQPRIKKATTCTNCRERHLKCDEAPECSRCRSEKTPCIYVASRRGQRKPSSTNRRHDAVGSSSRDGSRGHNTTIWTTPIVSGGGQSRLLSFLQLRPPGGKYISIWAGSTRFFLLIDFPCSSTPRLFCYCGRGETSTKYSSTTISRPESWTDSNSYFRSSSRAFLFLFFSGSSFRTSSGSSFRKVRQKW